MFDVNLNPSITVAPPKIINEDLRGEHLPKYFQPMDLFAALVYNLDRIATALENQTTKDITSNGD